jgi:hypothetical protein
MPTTHGCRKSRFEPDLTSLTPSRIFFPSTEPEVEEDWEEVEGGDSAENGPAEKESEPAAVDGTKITLPDVPTQEPVSEPTEDVHTSKKQKSDDE